MSTVALERPRVRRRRFQRACWTRCDDCGRMSSESTDSCQRCGATDLVSISRTGEIYSYTFVNNGREAYVLALVRLSDSRLITARIVDTGRDLRIGMLVEAVDSSTTHSEVLAFCPIASRVNPSFRRHSSSRAEVEA